LTNHNKVISLPSPSLWRFFDIAYSENADPIEDWYRNDLSEEAQLSFLATLKDIQKIENHANWLCFKRFLSGQKYKKYRIWELWFPGDKRQYRILGIFGPDRKQVALLMGCYHKGGVYTPQNALDSAHNRARDLAEGRATRRERKIPTDR